MAATNAKQTRDREIKLIHVGRRELQLDEETYRAMLQAVAGVDSAAKLDATGRRAVLDHMKRKGFKVKGKSATAPTGQKDADPQYRKIQALWTELAQLGAVRVNTEAAIRVYIKRITGVNDYAFCNSSQVTSIIETLKKWRDRVGGETRHVDPKVEDAHA
jgi:phage gp16-like protein